MSQLMKGICIAISIKGSGIMKLTSELVNRQKLVQMCLHGPQVWPVANVYSSGLAGLRQAQGGPTVMRLVLPDTSLPLLESQDAALTSQPLILCPFLLVSPAMSPDELSPQYLILLLTYHTKYTSQTPQSPFFSFYVMQNCKLNLYFLKNGNYVSICTQMGS